MFTGLTQASQGHPIGRSHRFFFATEICGALGTIFPEVGLVVPCSKTQQGIVHGERQEQPGHANGQGPNNQEELEVEVQLHTNA